MTMYEKRPEQVQAIKWSGTEEETSIIDAWLRQFNLSLRTFYVFTPDALDKKRLELRDRAGELVHLVWPHHWLVFHPYTEKKSLEVLSDSDFKHTYSAVEEPVDNDAS